jgi:HPt (histidine-containing phosphotransfer) domain-containing protein
MTAHALVEERQRCLDAGMNDHVSKPIDPDALFAVLKRWTKPTEARFIAAVAKPAPATGEVVLPEIQGVDLEDGLKRVAGNKRLFRSLLEQFAQKQRDAGAQIAAALQSEDRTLASRIAHTVKGVAGNLGIRAVQLAAGDVERAIRDEDASLPAKLEAFASTLRVAIQAIEGTLTGKTEVAVPRPETFDPGLASAAAARLRALLEANDGEAADAFAAVENALAGVVEKSRLDALRDAIGDFNFDGALSSLADIMRLCEVSAAEPKN